MAHIRKHGAGWRAEVERAGVRASRVFKTKAAATGWAAQEEAAILNAERGVYPVRTLRQAIERYQRDVLPKKVAGDRESLRLEALMRDHPALPERVFHQLGTPDWVAWRDARLLRVKGASVQRDINIISNLYTVARDEWKWCGASPLRGMTQPGDSPPRDVVWHWRQVRRVLRFLGYRTGRPPATRQQEIAWAMLLGLRTAMREAELLTLSTRTVNLNQRVATLERHKTDRQVGTRQVPLTRHGARLLRVLVDHACAQEREPLLLVRQATLVELFGRARDATLATGLTFHDTRATALTHLARKVDVMTLARISGHRDLKVLMTTYYRETAAQIAARL